MWNVPYLIPILIAVANCLFFNKKGDRVFKLNFGTPLIFISGTMSKIIRKNASCTNKNCVIYFCPETFIVLPFWEDSRANPAPRLPPARAPMALW